MKATIEESKVILKLELTQSEFLLLKQGIGNTSYNSRVKSGMEPSEAQFFEDLYDEITSSIRIKS